MPRCGVAWGGPALYGCTSLEARGPGRTASTQVATRERPGAAKAALAIWSRGHGFASSERPPATRGWSRVLLGKHAWPPHSPEDTVRDAGRAPRCGSDFSARACAARWLARQREIPWCRPKRGRARAAPLGLVCALTGARASAARLSRRRCRAQVRRGDGPLAAGGGHDGQALRAGRGRAGRLRLRGARARAARRLHRAAQRPGCLRILWRAAAALASPRVAIHVAGLCCACDVCLCSTA